MKKNMNVSKPSEYPPNEGEKSSKRLLVDGKILLLFVVSHIQRIGCQVEKATLHGGQSRPWSAEGFLPDIILLTLCYYHREFRLNAMKRFCLGSLCYSIR